MALEGLNTCPVCTYCWIKMDPQGAQYFCRRFPPQQDHVMVPQGGNRIAAIPHSAFPVVLKDWTCGEFVPRPQIGNQS